jgi:hypothetical protein
MLAVIELKKYGVKPYCGFPVLFSASEGGTDGERLPVSTGSELVSCSPFAASHREPVFGWTFLLGSDIFKSPKSNTTKAQGQNHQVPLFEYPFYLPYQLPSSTTSSPLSDFPTDIRNKPNYIGSNIA